MSEPLIDASGYSSSLPTPTAGDGERGAGSHWPRGNPPLAASLLPTPSANDSTGAEGETRKARQESGDTGGPALRDLTHLLPTPTSRDWKDGPPNENVEENALLGRSVWRMLPTPTSQAAKHGETPDLTANGSGYNLWDLPRLLPTGEPSGPPSSDGPASSDETLPGQLTIEDA